MNKLIPPILFLLSACAADDGAPVDDTEEPLLPSQVTIDATCSPAETQLLSAAVTQLGAFLADHGPNGALAILADRFYLGPRRAPETIIATLRAHVPTTISCSASLTSCSVFLDAEACGSLVNGAEAITVWKPLLDDPKTTTGHTAAALVAALAEAHGFGLPQMSPGFLPGEILAYFLRYGGLPFVARSSLPGETELAIVGEGGQNPFTMICAGADLMRGMKVVASGAQITALQLRCDSSSSQEVGVEPIGSFPHEQACPAGEVVVGITADDAKTFGNVGIECNRLANVQNGVGGYDYAQSFPANPFAVPAERLCPPYMIVDRVLGYASGMPGALRVECRDVRTFRRGAPTSLARVGVNEKVPSYELCTGFGGLHELEARWSGGSPRLQELVVDCSATKVDPGQTFPTPSGNFPWVDEWNQLPLYNDNAIGDCAFDEGMVGMEIYVGDVGIVGLDMLCARRSDWYGAAAVTPRTAAHLMPPSPPVTTTTHLVCPRATELGGLAITASTHGTLGAVTPLCRALGSKQ